MKSNQLDEWYRLYARPLYYYLWRLSGSEMMAEDLTQETFVRATIHLHKYKGHEPRAWLFRIARNVYIDEWRKKQRKQKLWQLLNREYKSEMISPYGLPEEEYLSAELGEQLEQLLTYLPENYRSIIYLREIEQFSYQEIMETLNLTEEQVKIQLYRARKRLNRIVLMKGWEYGKVE